MQITLSDTDIRRFLSLLKQPGIAAQGLSIVDDRLRLELLLNTKALELPAAILLPNEFRVFSFWQAHCRSDGTLHLALSKLEFPGLPRWLPMHTLKGPGMRRTIIARIPRSPWLKPDEDAMGLLLRCPPSPTTRGLGLKFQRFEASPKGLLIAGELTSAPAGVHS